MTEEMKERLRRFAKARKNLRIACSTLDCVHDDGSSIWSAAELTRTILEAANALNELVDLAEQVSTPLLGTTESLDEALDAMARELTGKL
jgi:hypothetical protein